jgi:4-cresol dehydrogenase (hydroxylating) flavoprotein subunit
MATKYVALPKGVSEKDFDSAITEFTRILGAENVIISAEKLAPFGKIMIPDDIKNHQASAAIMPGSKEEVQAIVGVCNKYKVPVWPVSTGRNFGYGSAAPATAGQVIMDLGRMNKIISVDPDLCTARVEPGVTYQQLYDYIQENNLPLWMSCPAPSAVVGPVGNTLDRGVGYTPYGEHFLFSCGMEVVMPTGELLKTGMGSIPKSNTWEVFKWGYGPYLDGIFTQSNFGIVTQLGIWLMPAPPAFKPFAVRFPEHTDIEKIVDTIRPLRIAMIIPNAVVIASDLWEAGTIVKRSDYYKGEGTIPQEAVDKIREDKKLGAWNVYAALYGAPQQIDVNWGIVKGAFEAAGGTIVTEEEAGDNPVFRYRADLMKGKPNLQEFGLYNWRGGGGSTWFAPVSQAKGSETGKQMVMAKRILDKYGFDYVGEFIVGWRDMHHIIDLLFDRTDPEEMTKANDCYLELLKAFSDEGYGTYRTSTAHMDEVAEVYGPVQKEINRKIKNALDPNGIIAPGKSGIYGG